MRIRPAIAVAAVVIVGPVCLTSSALGADRKRDGQPRCHDLRG
jgi:hypothetical protein